MQWTVRAVFCRSVNGTDYNGADDVDQKCLKSLTKRQKFNDTRNKKGIFHAANNKLPCNFVVCWRFEQR